MIWIKTPKTGGTSLYSYLKVSNLMHWPSVSNNWLHEEGKVTLVLPEETRRDEFQNIIWPDKFTFAVVRNPYDKLVSAWKYFPEFRDIPLRHFVKNLPKKEKDWDKWMHTTQTTVDFLAQYKPLEPDQIVKFETMERDLNDVFIANGFKPFSLPNQNQSERKRDWRFYMTPEIEEAIYQHFKEDFDVFGYERWNYEGI